jgi:hypothetical protein
MKIHQGRLLKIVPVAHVNSIRQELAKAVTPVLVIAGWGVVLGSLGLTAVVQGLVIPHNPQFSVESVLPEIILYYLGIFAASVIAGLILQRLGLALFGFIASYFIGIILCYVVLTIPGLVGYVPEAPAEGIAFVFVFTAFFPIALFVGLLGALLGGAAREI